MGGKELRAMAVAALATMGITLAVLLPWVCVAEPGDKGAAPEIRWPTLKHEGCEITLRTDKRAYEANESPTVQLEVVNTTSDPAQIEAVLKMMAQPMASRESRMMPRASAVWEQKCPLSVDGFQTKTFSIPVAAKVPAARLVFFTLQIGKAAVSTPPINAATGQASLNSLTVLNLNPAQ